MTRWGILSDVHGNLPNLEAALAIFEQRGIDRIAVLGDNLGRGDSDGCVDLIRKVASVSIQGNRDLDWQSRVGQATAAYVLALPRVALIDDIVFSHGDVRLTRDLSSADIKAGFPRARRTMAERGARVWMFGHSHCARVWRLTGMNAAPALLYDVRSDGLPALVHLDPAADADARWIINAGSVGLPFPGKGPASCAIYDSDASTVELLAISAARGCPLPVRVHERRV